MEQIVKLLFATTLLAIFAYILIFTSLGRAGNGGEYWGFDGRLSVADAAQITFESGDHRFLEVRLHQPLEPQNDYVPGVAYCGPEYHEPGLPKRPSVSEPIHGQDSPRLADEFARSFNIAMAEMLNENYDAECVVLRSK